MNVLSLEPFSVGGKVYSFRAVNSRVLDFPEDKTRASLGTLFKDSLDGSVVASLHFKEIGVDRRRSRKGILHGLHGNQFTTKYHHSEQWLRIYLERNSGEYLKLAIDNLLKHKGHGSGYVVGRTPIMSVILHVHSTNDICERCSPTLHRFITKPDGFKDRIKTYISEKYRCTDKLNFSLITTSRIHYGHQRIIHGHDYGFVTPIDLMQFRQMVVIYRQYWRTIHTL